MKFVDVFVGMKRGGGTRAASFSINSNGGRTRKDVPSDYGVLRRKVRCSSSMICRRPAARGVGRRSGPAVPDRPDRRRRCGWRHGVSKRGQRVHSSVLLGDFGSNEIILHVVLCSLAGLKVAIQSVLLLFGS